MDGRSSITDKADSFHIQISQGTMDCQASRELSGHILTSYVSSEKLLYPKRRTLVL